MCTHTSAQKISLNYAAVGGFLQVLVQFDDPLLILLLLNSSHLFQLTGPLVLQHLLIKKMKTLESFNTTGAHNIFYKWVQARIHGKFIKSIFWNIWSEMINWAMPWDQCTRTITIYLLRIKVLRGYCIHILVTQSIPQLMHHFIHFSCLPTKWDNINRFD